MQVLETERSEELSIVEVKHSSPLSMEMLRRGLCELARSRRAPYLQFQTISDPPLRIQVLFPKSFPEATSASAKDVETAIWVDLQCPIPPVMILSR